MCITNQNFSAHCEQNDLLWPFSKPRLLAPDSAQTSLVRGCHENYAQGFKQDAGA